MILQVNIDCMHTISDPVETPQRFRPPLNVLKRETSKENISENHKTIKFHNFWPTWVHFLVDFPQSPMHLPNTLALFALYFGLPNLDTFKCWKGNATKPAGDMKYKKFPWESPYHWIKKSSLLIQKISPVVVTQLKPSEPSHSVHVIEIRQVGPSPPRCCHFLRPFCVYLWRKKLQHRLTPKKFNA